MSFFMAIEGYKESILAYRQFGELVASALSENAAKREEVLLKEIESILEPFRRFATSEEKESLIKAIKGIMPRIKAQLHEPKEPSEQFLDESGENTQEDALKKWDMPVRSGRTFVKVVKRIRSMASSSGLHTNILYRGILTGLVSQFEVLLSDIAYQFYRRTPNAVSSQDKQLSVSDLLSFDNIEEAIEYVIGERIDDLLRGNADDWRKFFNSRLKVDLANLSPDWDRFVEYLQRRHIIVHAGGRISRRYLQNVAPALVSEYFEEPRIGATAPLGDDYVSNGIYLFEVTGLLFAFSSWAKLGKEERTLQAGVLLDVIYSSMLQSSWGLVLHLAQWGMNQETFNSDSRMACRVNHWLAMKRTGRWIDCKEEVENFDTSALRSIYAIARASLLENNDLFFSLVDSTKATDFDEIVWDEWPVFAEMRRDPRFIEYRAKYLQEPSPESAGKEDSTSSTTVSQD